MRLLKTRAAVAAGLFALLAALYWPLLLFPARFVWFDHYDLTELQIPRIQFFARSLHAGHLPLWNPNIWLGQPVLGSGQPGLLNPLVFLFAALTPLRDYGLSFSELNWLYVALHFAAALFAYRFCRYLDLAVLPCLLGALAFSCTGFLGSIPWIDISSAVALTPLIFYFAFRLWSEGGTVARAAPLGLVLGLSWWTGHHEIPLLNGYAVLLASVGMAGFHSWKQRKLDWPLLKGLAIAFVLAMAVSAVQTLPFYEFGRMSRRWVGVSNPIGWADKVPYEVHARYSLPWLGLSEFFVPGGAPEDHWTVFGGVTILTLAIIALIYRWSDPRVKLLGFLGLGSVLYALGAHTPFQRLIYEFLPLADKARSPGRGIFLAGFALSALAASGADLLVRRLVSRKAMWIPAGVWSAVLIVYLSGRVPEMESPIQTHFVMKGFIAALCLGFLLWFWREKRGARPSKLSGIALLAIILLEASTLTAHRITDLTSGNAVVAPSLTKFNSLGDTLRDPEHSRVIADYNSLMTDLGDLYGVDVLQSFVSAVPENVLRLEFQTARTEQLLGVTDRIEDGRLHPAAQAMSRAWVVHRVVVAKDVGELRRSIQDPALNFAATAVSLQTLPALEDCAEDQTPSFRRPDSDSVLVDADLRCRGLLIVSEAFYPGWTAYVDGQPQTIYEVFGALRGIVLESGRHRVELRYRPPIVAAGAALSFAGIAVCLVLAFATRRRTGASILDTDVINAASGARQNSDFHRRVQRRTDHSECS